MAMAAIADLPTIRPAPSTRVLRISRFQIGLPDGKVNWTCQRCQTTFMADYCEEPEACPSGHTP